MDTSSSIISKVCSFCNTLRDDGVGYGDYLEQLIYLLFLKMTDKSSKSYLSVCDKLEAKKICNKQKHRSKVF